MIATVRANASKKDFSLTSNERGGLFFKQFIHTLFIAQASFDSEFDKDEIGEYKLLSDGEKIAILNQRLDEIGAAAGIKHDPIDQNEEQNVNQHLEEMLRRCLAQRADWVEIILSVANKQESI